MKLHDLDLWVKIRAKSGPPGAGRCRHGWPGFRRAMTIWKWPSEITIFG